MGQGDDIDRIDRALLALRRFVTAPPSVPHEGERVETSTVLVVDAVVRGGHSTVRDVARALHVAPSSASRLVSRAVDARMIRRSASPDDPRAAALAATNAGRRLHAAALRHRHGQLERLLADWSSHERGQFADALGRFTDGLS